MSMGDVVDLFEYWRDYPPVHVILREVHKSPDGRPGAGSTPVTEEQTLQALFEAQKFFGPHQEMPQHLKELADYAEETLSKMKIN